MCFYEVAMPFEGAIFLPVGDDAGTRRKMKFNTGWNTHYAGKSRRLAGKIHNKIKYF
jgi:hypothetical protein